VKNGERALRIAPVAVHDDDVAVRDFEGVEGEVAGGEKVEEAGGMADRLAVYEELAVADTRSVRGMDNIGGGTFDRVDRGAVKGFALGWRAACRDFRNARAGCLRNILFYRSM